MIQKNKLKLYLPIGTIKSEQLLFILEFIEEYDIETVFINNKKLNIEEDVEEKKNEEEILDSSFLSWQSNDDFSDSFLKENSFFSNNSINSDNSEFKKFSESEFKKNIEIQKKMSKRKIKLRSKDFEKEKYDKSVSLTKPTLEKKGKYYHKMYLIIFQILKQYKFRKSIVEMNIKKLKINNYLIYIREKIEKPVNFIFDEIYNMSSNLLDISNIVQNYLKKLLNNLNYFENYLLVENSFLFGEKMSLIDIILFSALHRMFQFFFSEKIRTFNLINITKWFQKIIIKEEYKKVFGNFKFCSQSYISILEYEKRKSSHSGISENSKIKKFEILEAKNIFEDLIFNKFSQLEFQSKIDQLSIFFDTEEYQMFFFEYIIVEESFIDDESDMDINDNELFQFFKSIKNISNKLKDFIVYVVIYKNFDDEDTLLKNNYDSNKREEKFFSNGNLLKGAFFSKGKLPEDIQKFESSDLIHIIKIENTQEFITTIVKEENHFQSEKVVKKYIF